MAWRTKGCGCATGVGCRHEAPAPVCVVQGESVSLTYVSLTDVAGQLVRAEVRTSAGGNLLLDMAPYASTDPSTPNRLMINVPGEVTAAMLSSGYYDVWVGDERLGYGPWLLELSVSILPGLPVTIQSWTPMLVAGEPFVRQIATQGMLPNGESISMAGGDAAPELTVYNLDGSIRFVAKGYPWLDVTADPETVHLTLDDVDTSIIGPGRFTYSLVVSNEYREARTLLTGMMLVEEGAYVEPYRR